MKENNATSANAPAPQPRKVGRPRKQAAPATKRPRGRKPATHADLSPTEVEALQAVTQRLSTTYGPLVILALTQLFKWFEKVHLKLSAALLAQDGKGAVAPATRKLIRDLAELRGLMEADAATERTAPRAAAKRRKTTTRRRRKSVRAKASLTPTDGAPKRRRGRPRKVQTAEANGTTQQTAVTAAPAPRRRGRPRKVQTPEANSAAQQAAVTVTPAPRRRGRPRKVQPIEAKDAAQQAEVITDPAPQTLPPAEVTSMPVQAQESTPVATPTPVPTPVTIPAPTPTTDAPM